MEAQEIRARVAKMKTVADLANLLQDLKVAEFHTEKYPITADLLHVYAHSRPGKLYHSFKIRKKNGKFRTINAPTYQLKIILYFLNQLFKAVFEPSSAAMGFAPGRSIVDNAAMHTGHHYVLNIDLKDFFPSIRQARVWKRLQLPPFNFSQPVANVVAAICCAPNEEGTDNVLPQGAPTSPILTNAICCNLDRRMQGMARKFGLHYSRYADDMSFSSMCNLFKNDGEVLTEIRRIVEEQGFTMNEEKTRVLRSKERQEVTGLIVNDKVNVTRRYVKDLRRTLHHWEALGYETAYARFYMRYKAEKGYIKKGEPVMENVIEGRLNFLRMVKGETNSTFQNLWQRYSKLPHVVYVDNTTDKGISYTYVQPYSVARFEELFHTNVHLKISQGRNPKLVGKCVINGLEKTLAVSHSSQKILCPNLSNYELGQTILSEKLKDCFITLCHHKGKNFWLITVFEPVRNECQNITNSQVNVDELLQVWEKDGIKAAAEEFKQLLQPHSVEQTSALEKKKNTPKVKVLQENLPFISPEDLKAFDDGEIVPLLTIGADDLLTWGNE